MSACKRLFGYFCSIVKLRESKKASTNFCLNESQKVFLLPALCGKGLYSLNFVAILLANTTKPLKLYCF